MSRGPKTYRLGLYGRTGSGKTCILAALYKRLIPDESDLTCTFVPPDPKDRRHKVQVEGMKWLEAAWQRLSNGDRPEPNPHSEIVGSRLVRFDFTSPTVAEFRAELLDYSGELVNPFTQNDPKSLAAALLKHMAAMDGLLIVAEAPRNSGADAEPTEELLLLAAAFNEVKARELAPCLWRFS